MPCVAIRCRRGRAGDVAAFYCSDHCRQLAYSERLEHRFETEVVEPPQPVPGSVLDRWITEGAKFDEIVQDPYLLGRFMDDLMCRIAVDHILEDHRYQHAVNQLIVTFFMIGRMSGGNYRLPVAVWRLPSHLHKVPDMPARRLRRHVGRARFEVGRRSLRCPIRTFR